MWVLRLIAFIGFLGILCVLAPCASLAIGFSEEISGGINSKPGGVEHGFRGEVWYGVSLPIVSIMCYVLWQSQ